MLVALVLTAACGQKKVEPAAPAARVDDEDVTLQQINLVLQQQRNLRPEQADAASRQILERLIDQTLAAAKAKSLELDRDPKVLQQVEAARREVLARAYLEQVGEAATQPTADEVSAYYRSKPALFAERRIYNIQELNVEADPAQVPALRQRLTDSGSIAEFIEYLKSSGHRFAGNQAVRAAEQLPASGLEMLSRMRDGQATLSTSPNGAQVLVLAGSRSQPVNEEQARPAIEQYLLNERRRKLAEESLKTMRAAAKIEYVGKFAEGPRPGAAGEVALGASSPGSAKDLNPK